MKETVKVVVDGKEYHLPEKSFKLLNDKDNALCYDERVKLILYYSKGTTEN